jgi:regulatory protein
MDAAEARQAALRMLTRREHGRKELEGKLINKGCTADIAAQVAAGLEAEGLLSDDRFVEALVRVRRQRGCGPLRIQKELQQKGVAEDVVERWLDVAGDDWVEAVKRVCRRKYGGKVPKSLSARAKQARFLQYRGFTFDQIRQALNPRGRD